MKIMVSLILLFLLVKPYELKKLKSAKIDGDSNKQYKIRVYSEGFIIGMIYNYLEIIQDIAKKFDNLDDRVKLMKIYREKMDLIQDIRSNICKLNGEMIRIVSKYESNSNHKDQLNRYKNIESFGRIAASEVGSELGSDTFNSSCDFGKDEFEFNDCSNFCKLQDTIKNIYGVEKNIITLQNAKKVKEERGNEDIK